jgi:uncharacterized MAPEG superfamily protein
MTIPFWCLAIATFLPFVLAITASAFRARQFGAVDNKQPRLQQAQQTGAGARAMAAQQNAWEALAMFTPAVLVAHISAPGAQQAALAATIFIAARLLHPIFYIADQDKLRSVSFVIGFACCVWLFVIAVLA